MPNPFLVICVDRKTDAKDFGWLLFLTQVGMIVESDDTSTCKLQSEKEHWQASGTHS
jgi:hypothetical protein